MDELPVICTDNADAQNVKFFEGKQEDAEMRTNSGKVVKLGGLTEGAMFVYAFYDGIYGFFVLLFAPTEVKLPCSLIRLCQPAICLLHYNLFALLHLPMINICWSYLC